MEVPDVGSLSMRDSAASHNIEYSLAEEIEQLRKEVELLKDDTPSYVANMALELQRERSRLNEAMEARDAAVHRLWDTYMLLHEKIELIQHLQSVNHNESSISSSLPQLLTDTGNADVETLKAHISTLDGIIVKLRAEIGVLKEKEAMIQKLGAPPRYEEGTPSQYNISCDSFPLSATPASHSPQPDTQTNSRLILTPSPNDSGRSTPNLLARGPSSDLGNEANGMIKIPLLSCDSAQKWKQARFDILACIPLPLDAPEETLRPLTIPPPLTLQDFINSAFASAKRPCAFLLSPFTYIFRIVSPSFKSYKIFQSTTTHWCPSREEHGFFYTPVFRCSTNPRVVMAHRWVAVDVMSSMKNPTECFFNKDGMWYYAGLYKAFRIEDLTVSEWSELPTETTQAIVNETLSARKNTSPQNVYETTQLYACGALKVACIGIQCVGFSNDVYQTLLDQSDKAAYVKNKALVAAGLASAGLLDPFSDSKSIRSSSSRFTSRYSSTNSLRNVTTPSKSGSRSSGTRGTLNRVSSHVNSGSGNHPAETSATE